MARPPRTYQLTHDIVAQHGVVCVNDFGIGRTYALYRERPGARLNTALRRAEVIGGDGQVQSVTPSEGDPLQPTVTRVDIRGPIEQRAGYHEPCGGWSDGHDAIAERLVAALEVGDVVLVIDSPGGAHAGLQEAVRRVVEEKLEHGRRILTYGDEMIGSAAFWWAAAVSDAIYVPESGIVGSVGSRGAHRSEAGALAKDGIEVTYFCWPGPGKTAFAPELPLSDTGKQRGERDVAIAGEAFAAAVVAARGDKLNREALVELDADALPASLALRAGLIDGIASLEDVMAQALAQAGEAEQPEQENDMSIETAKPQTRTEDAPPAAPPAPPADKKECGSCNAANDDDAKYCDKCGEPMAADADDPDGDDDRAGGPDDPPASKPGKPAGHPPPPERAQSRQANSLAELAGLRRGASNTAILAALAPKVGLADFVMHDLEAMTPSQARGLYRAQKEDAASAGKLRADLQAQQRATAKRERRDLLSKLAAADLAGYRRGDLFVDEVDAASGHVTTKPAPIYAEMKLGTLRGLVEGKLRSAGPTGASRSPFEPDLKTAKDAASGVAVTDEDRRMAERNGLKAEDVAASRAALFPKTGAASAQNWSIGQ